MIPINAKVPWDGKFFALNLFGVAEHDPGSIVLIGYL